MNSDASSPVKVKSSKRREKDFILGPKSKEDAKLAKARLRAAKVPKPQLRPLTSLPDKEAFLEYCRAKAHTWVTNADTFLLSVDINDRPKNTEDLKSSAAHSIRSMETQPEDARSAIYKDKNGITLACVLAWRVPGCPKLTDTQRRREIYGLFTGRRELRDIGAGGGHPFGAVLDYAKPQGFGQNGPFMPSSDFFRGCQAALAVNYYYKLTERVQVAIYLQCAFAEAFPTYYAKYTSAFKAGVWETADPGPWLGRAIVYKLQVGEHVDGLDDGPTACFCVGNFDGGPMYLPDIVIVLETSSYSCPGSYITALESGRRKVTIFGEAVELKENDPSVGVAYVPPVLLSSKLGAYKGEGPVQLIFNKSVIEDAFTQARSKFKKPLFASVRVMRDKKPDGKCIKN
ncbi:hypothetical protein B0H14DRAFT_3130256 [Mycena olivaceomarginata]|nr:hypothetical protein B0H14DRAFT_3130256 [Mycena olivaceomarginata]